MAEVMIECARPTIYSKSFLSLPWLRTTSQSPSCTLSPSGDSSARPPVKLTTLATYARFGLLVEALKCRRHLLTAQSSRVSVELWMKGEEFVCRLNLWRKSSLNTRDSRRAWQGC